MYTEDYSRQLNYHRHYCIQLNSNNPFAVWNLQFFDMIFIYTFFRSIIEQVVEL